MMFAPLCRTCRICVAAIHGPADDRTRPWFTATLVLLGLLALTLAGCGSAPDAQKIADPAADDRANAKPDAAEVKERNLSLEHWRGRLTVEALEDRFQALKEVESMGAAARPLLPLLGELFRHPDETTRRLAMRIVAKRVDPELEDPQTIAAFVAALSEGDERSFVLEHYWNDRLKAGVIERLSKTLDEQSGKQLSVTVAILAEVAPDNAPLTERLCHRVIHGKLEDARRIVQRWKFPEAQAKKIVDHYEPQIFDREKFAAVAAVLKPLRESDSRVSRLLARAEPHTFRGPRPEKLGVTARQRLQQGAKATPALTEQLQPLLPLALAKSNRKQREEIVFVLVANGDVRAQPAFAKWLSHKEPAVRLRGASAILAINPYTPIAQQAIGTVAPLWDELDPEIAASIALLDPNRADRRDFRDQKFLMAVMKVGERLRSRSAEIERLAIQAAGRDKPVHPNPFDKNPLARPESKTRKSDEEHLADLGRRRDAYGEHLEVLLLYAAQQLPFYSDYRYLALTKPFQDARVAGFTVRPSLIAEALQYRVLRRRDAHRRTVQFDLRTPAIPQTWKAGLDDAFRKVWYFDPLPLISQEERFVAGFRRAQKNVAATLQKAARSAD